MTTQVTENRLKFETFKKKRNKTFTTLPKWFTEDVFKKMLELINAGKRLEAVKLIHTLAKEKKTDMLLKVAKEEYLDEIELIGGKIGVNSAPPAPKLHSTLANIVRDLEANKKIPATGINLTQKNEILRTLEPFARMANQCLHNSNLNSNQIVYAYNGASITMQDLRNVEVLVKRLAR